MNIKILILYLILAELKCQASDDICLLQSIETKCERDFNYKCAGRYCSNSKSSCFYFKRMNQKLIYLNKLRSTAKLTLDDIYKYEYNNYYQFIKKFRKCPVYDFNAVCVNGKRCLAKRKLPIRLDGITLLTKIQCPCTKDHPYTCGKQYCTLDKPSCVNFLFKNSNLTIHSCGNDDMTLYI